MSSRSPCETPRQACRAALPDQPLSARPELAAAERMCLADHRERPLIGRRSLEVIEVASHCLLVERIVVRVSAPPLTHALEHGVSVRVEVNGLGDNPRGSQQVSPLLAHLTRPE